MSRACFGALRLDEFARDGFVSHAIAVPREAFQQGLQFSAIERGLEAYWQEQERKHKENREVPSVPIGSVPEFELEWSDADASDVGRLRQLVRRGSRSTGSSGRFRERGPRRR